MIELIELSDLAWSIIDPTGAHEAIEQVWTAALPEDWAPAVGIDDLRIRLGEIAGRLSRDGDRALLEVASAVIVFLAAHPDRRRIEQAVIGEALREEYGDSKPDWIADWLARRDGPAARVRAHGADAPRRHFHSRPPVAPDG